MTGWDAVRRVTLAEPWQESWVEVYLDPPLGAWLDLKDALRNAGAAPTRENLDTLVGFMAPLIAAHTIPSRDGTPFAWDTAHMGARLIRVVSEAIIAVQEGGESADPLSTSATSPAGG